MNHILKYCILPNIRTNDFRRICRTPSNYPNFKFVSRFLVMAESDVENFPGEGEQPPEVVPEEATSNSDPATRFAYWKTYPGIWKILEVIFGVISLICIIICFIPEWTWSDWYEHGRECPTDWVMVLVPEKDAYYLKAKIIETRYGGAIILSRKLDKAPSGLDPIGHIVYNLTNSSNGELRYKGKKVYECYGSLTFPNGTFGVGRHDIWLYAWAITVICGFVVSIVIIVCQIRDSNFVNKTKLLVICYYLIIIVALELPPLSMIVYIVRNMTGDPKISLPRAVPCLVGGFCTLINLVFYFLSFHWSIMHKAP